MEYKIKLIKDEGQKKPKGTNQRIYFEKTKDSTYWVLDEGLDLSSEGYAQDYDTFHLCPILTETLKEIAQFKDYPGKLEISLKVE